MNQSRSLADLIRVWSFLRHSDLACRIFFTTIPCLNFLQRLPCCTRLRMDCDTLPGDAASLHTDAYISNDSLTVGVES